LRLSLSVLVLASGLAANLSANPAITVPCSPSEVKIPCRDMGDGRILVDALYLPDSVIAGKSDYTIIHTRPTSMQGEWANLVCTLKMN